MSVDRAEVERIAHLARLALDEAEVERLTKDMNDILEHATTLRALAHAAPSLEEGRAIVAPAQERGFAPTDDGPLGAVREAAAEATDAAGGTRAAAAETPDAPGGTRDAAAETPDPLTARPEAFAPRVAEGFFVVPPPPGVTGEDDRIERDRGDDRVERERAERD